MGKFPNTADMKPKGINTSFSGIIRQELFPYLRITTALYSTVASTIVTLFPYLRITEHVQKLDMNLGFFQNFAFIAPIRTKGKRVK
jgi:hypothetical protein